MFPDCIVDFTSYKPINNILFGENNSQSIFKAQNKIKAMSRMCLYAYAVRVPS